MNASDIFPVEYFIALNNEIGESADIKSYLNTLKRYGDDTIEAETNYNIFAKWFRKRLFEISDGFYEWEMIRDFMDVSVVHYHTIMDRFLYGVNMPIRYDLYEGFEKILSDDSLRCAADLRICSSIFVDWGVERWPMVEATKFFSDLMIQTKPALDFKTKNILQAFPGFMAVFPKGYIRAGSNEYLAFAYVSHDSNEENTEFISIVLVTDKLKIRVINTMSSHTVEELLNSHKDCSFTLKIILNMLFYFMAVPEDKPTSVRWKNTGEKIMIGYEEEEIEIWRPSVLGSKIKITGGSHYRPVTNFAQKKRPHWRRGHWRYYDDHMTWIKPIFINKHLVEQ